MSISDEIKARIAALDGSRLFHLPPLFPAALTLRTMVVSEEVRDAVTEFPENWDGLKRSKFRADLDAFTEGQELSVAENPLQKPNDTMLARVDPVGDEIWSIRNIDPSPGIRCLGAFGGIDLFIALTWDYRDGFDWQAEIQRCKADWANLFGSTPRFRGATLDAYLSKYYAV